jgi:polysaccharide export outer membrane protein
MKSTVLRNIIAIAAAVLFLFSAQSQTAGAAEKAVKNPKDGKSAAKTLAQHPDYVIGIEDVIEISVWKNPDLSKIVRVRPDGLISLPLVGELKAAGLTPAQLRDSLNEVLKEYQETVVTSVIVQEVNSYRIFILGEVMSPGTYTMPRRMSVIQAIALAGGFNPFASRKIVLVRENGNNMAEKIEISFDDIVDTDARRDKNLILKPGDTVFVQ